MFGENPIRKAEHGDGMQLDVVEVFPTIQGEGPFMGHPAIFVRLWGCNLKCFFCDTDFETKRRHLSANDLFREVDEIGGARSINLVVITGGEPLRQNIIPLIQSLLIAGYNVQIETSGSLWLDELDTVYRGANSAGSNTGKLSIVVSPKSGKVHEKFAGVTDAWKYVIRAGAVSEVDGLPKISYQTVGKRQHIARPLNNAPIYVQPCDEHDESKSRLNLHEVRYVAQFHGYRVSLQMHKILGVE